jgi:hypothetical protein
MKITFHQGLRSSNDKQHCESFLQCLMSNLHFMPKPNSRLVSHLKSHKSREIPQLPINVFQHADPIRPLHRIRATTCPTSSCISFHHHSPQSLHLCSLAPKSFLQEGSVEQIRFLTPKSLEDNGEQSWTNYLDRIFFFFLDK